MQQKKSLQDNSDRYSGYGRDELSSNALAQEQKAPGGKDVAWAQAKANEHYLIQRFN